MSDGSQFDEDEGPPVYESTDPCMEHGGVYIAPDVYVAPDAEESEREEDTWWHYPTKQSRQTPCPQCKNDGRQTFYLLSADCCPRCGYAEGRHEPAVAERKKRIRRSIPQVREYCDSRINTSQHRAIREFLTALRKFVDGEISTKKMGKALDRLYHARPTP